MAHDSPLVFERLEIMTPETGKIQFSRQIWQAASEHAYLCLVRRDFCPEQSHTENLRCVHLAEETEANFGRQLWFFEAVGVDTFGRRHVLHGLLEFSIQYGLLETSQTAMFEENEARSNFLVRELSGSKKFAYSYPSTKFWVYAAWTSIAVLGAIWVSALVNYLTRPQPQDSRGPLTNQVIPASGENR